MAETMNEREEVFYNKLMELLQDRMDQREQQMDEQAVRRIIKKVARDF